MNDFKLKGHLTPTQYYEQLFSANGNQPSPTPSNVGTDIEVSDFEIEDVDPKKKEVPFFTKKGKFVIAVIVVGSALYYFWNKHKASKEQASAPTAQPTTVEKTNETAQSVSNEQGTEGADLV